MGLICERSPLVERKKEKEKGKKEKKKKRGRHGPWGPCGWRPTSPSPLAGHTPPSKGFSPTLLGEGGLTPFSPHI